MQTHGTERRKIHISRKATFWLGLAVCIALISGCAVKVTNSKRLTNTSPETKAIAFIWTSAKGPKSVSNLPSLSVLPISTWGSTRFLDNYRSEEDLLVSALENALRNEPSLKMSSFNALPYFSTPSQLREEVDRIPLSSSIVELHVERVVSYCTPGCYAFKLRADYLAPDNRVKVWTALIDLPPKAKHSDAFDSIAQDFAKVLKEKLISEQLMP